MKSLQKQGPTLALLVYYVYYELVFDVNNTSESDLCLHKTNVNLLFGHLTNISLDTQSTNKMGDISRPSLRIPNRNKISNHYFLPQACYLGKMCNHGSIVNETFFLLQSLKWKQFVIFKLVIYFQNHTLASFIYTFL